MEEKDTKGIVVQFWDGSDQVFRSFMGKTAHEKSSKLINDLLSAGHHQVRVINHQANVVVMDWKWEQQQQELDK